MELPLISELKLILSSKAAIALNRLLGEVIVMNCFVGIETEISPNAVITVISRNI